ncbi:MAG: methionyl-tRNA formyltransferase [Gemmatimonadota bacterium]|nr:methionyl-tRNA formyltransferase [Gemmatimonadota bacterium]
MRTVFFGTPKFAVPSLQALLKEGATIVAVVTQPDRPQGRSRSTLIPSPVKEVALAHDIPVFQPDRPTGDLFLTAMRRLEPALGVVVAYGHLLKPELLAIPPFGMLNVHASLLPAHRGAAPIQWSLMAGDTSSGVTIMQMEAGLDSGPIRHQLATPITPWDTAGSLTERLAELGAVALVEALALDRIEQLPSTPQDHSLATHAPKINRELARLDWSTAAEAVGRRIRAFDPAPGAWTTLEGGEVKLFGARPVPENGPPGTILAMTPSLVVATGTDAVAIDEVQPTGKKRMSAEDWARGRGAAVGQRFQ